MPKLNPKDLDKLRKQQIRLIHVAKRQMGLDDENYRTVLYRATNGKTSCKDMTLGELNQAMDAFRKLGFKPASPGGKGKKLSPRSRHKQAKDKTQIDLIRALWIEAFQAGVVRNRHEDGEGGLNQFVNRLTKIQRVEWLRDPEQASKVVEALKAMLRRRGIYVSSGVAHGRKS